MHLKKLLFTTICGLLIILVGCSGNSQNDEQQTNTEDNPSANTSQQQEDPSAALTAVMENGKQVYTQYCLACHQADGKGVQGAFPPLQHSDWVNGDKTRLISVIINGLQGPIEVNGEAYNAMMPAHNFLSDEQIAAVLTYVLNSFENDGGEITVAEVTAARETLEEDSASSD